MYLFCDIENGPKMLVVCEKWHLDNDKSAQWGPPGGGANLKDTNEWQSAVREFGEEVGVDWSHITSTIECFTWLRITREYDDGARWALLVNKSMEDVSRSLDFNNANRRGTNETCGVDWINCQDVVGRDMTKTKIDLVQRKQKVFLRQKYAEDTKFVIETVLDQLEQRSLFCIDK